MNMSRSSIIVLAGTILTASVFLSLFTSRDGNASEALDKCKAPGASQALDSIVSKAISREAGESQAKLYFQNRTWSDFSAEDYNPLTGKVSCSATVVNSDKQTNVTTRTRILYIVTETDTGGIMVRVTQWSSF